MCRIGSRTSCATRTTPSTRPTIKPSPRPSGSSHSAGAWEFHLGSASRASRSARSRSRPPSASPPGYKQSYVASPSDLIVSSEDPAHPIVALATERIVELSTRKAAVTDALEALNEKRPAGHHPDEILSMLNAVPDLRQTLKTAAHDELAEIFRAFRREDHLRQDPPSPRPRRNHHARTPARPTQ